MFTSYYYYYYYYYFSSQSSLLLHGSKNEGGVSLCCFSGDIFENTDHHQNGHQATMAMLSLIAQSRSMMTVHCTRSLVRLSSVAAEIAQRQTLSGIPRDVDGSRSSRKFRQSGFIPALLYGAGQDKQLLKVKLNG
jgi:hypothetical protein